MSRKSSGYEEETYSVLIDNIHNHDQLPVLRAVVDQGYTSYLHIPGERHFTCMPSLVRWCGPPLFLVPLCSRFAISTRSLTDAYQDQPDVYIARKDRVFD